MSHPEDLTAPLEATAPAAAIWPPGRMLGDRYRIGRVLERGGTAIVYEATQTDLVRRVAIKVPTAECAADEYCARRFESEARTLAVLQHPHIVSVYELGRAEEGTGFMVMELLEGPSLREHLARQGPLRWQDALVPAVQLAEALEAAHVGGIVHGDVSAGNVLLSRRGQALDCKLIDFGAAHRIGATDGRQRTYGTARYVAPELLAGVAPHVPSDIFALGVVLQEMLGEKGFSTAPVALRHLVASMCDLEASLRPASAGAVARRLRVILAQQHAPRSRKVLLLPIGLLLLTALGAIALTIPQARPPEIVSSTHALRPSPLPLPPPPRSPAVPLQSEPAAEPPASVPKTVVHAAARRPRAAAAAAEPGFELARDATLDQVELVAALDRWLSERNAGVARDRVPVMAMRVGRPQIAFDPSGSSASVTYRKRFVYARASRIEESIVEEQLFFAKVDGIWRIVTTSRGV